MNWDISIGRTRQLLGRVLQGVGGRLAHRKLVLDGEALEYAGRLQMRYGMLKHQAQWGDRLGGTAAHFARLKPTPITIERERTYASER